VTQTPNTPAPETELSARQLRSRKVLAAAVRHATGLPDAQPRPGQMMLVDDLTRTAEKRGPVIGGFGSTEHGGHAIGVAPTGVGKSLSALATAAVGVVDHDERWLISTESIALQAQYVDKDGPVIAAAAEEVTGRPVTVAQLKGWSNYVCAVKMRSTVEDLTGAVPSHNPTKAAATLPKRKLGTIDIDGRPVDGDRLVPLLDWALKQHVNDDDLGDRGHYPGAVSEAEWSQVAVSPSECIGPVDCPLASICKPNLARNRAAEADIVVTNHSMLAVQASAGVPVVIGNKNLGTFQGLIIDEAHALPATVRSQGQSEMSGRRILNVSRAVTKVCSDRDPKVRRWIDAGRFIVDEVDRELHRNVKNTNQVSKVAETQDPLADSGDPIGSWLDEASRLLKNAGGGKASPAARIASNRAQNVVDQAMRDLDSVREHRVGVARWFESIPGGGGGRRDWAAVQSAPVSVGQLMARNLYVERITEDGEEMLTELAVGAISATIAEGFARDAGLNTQAKKYPSPFDTAYGSSMLYIPRAVAAGDVAAITAVSRYNGKPSFDTGKHAEWAAVLMRQLVEANSGSALVLSSTVSAGKEYARLLREQARGRFQVLSQWDGENVRVITQRWRDDPTSVMVGTRSLMTGVDAPGETCTLVIVDRAPRSASNPVDDARVEMISEAIGDKWTADRLVYVADAALLLEQAAGRLIRSMSDSGMVAVLDPRMLNAGPYKYQTPTRTSFLRAFERFTRKTSDIDEAVKFLRERDTGASRSGPKPSTAKTAQPKNRNPK
jgi:ATP-dependent DNA helicase DinG